MKACQGRNGEWKVVREDRVRSEGGFLGGPATDTRCGPGVVARRGLALLATRATLLAAPAAATLLGSGRGPRVVGRSSRLLASALLANGVRLMGRSFKYHRPRGVLSAGSEEPNALVEVDRGGGACTPNLRATQVEVYDGLVARSQNRFPSLAFDMQAVNDLLAEGARP